MTGDESVRTQRAAEQAARASYGKLIAFALPPASELPARLGAVLEAVYAAYGTGWDNIGGAEDSGHALTTEAIWLARVVTQVMPDEPEARGLLALLLHCEARRAARRSPAGHYVSLRDQDVRLWSGPLIDEAEQELARAAQQRVFGPFQLEAAIQSAHAKRRHGRPTNWSAIVLLYEALLVGVRVAHAAALAEAQNADSALALLDALPAAEVATYQPYWAVRAHLCRYCNHFDDAKRCLERALGLTEDPAVRAFLSAQTP